MRKLLSFIAALIGKFGDATFNVFDSAMDKSFDFADGCMDKSFDFVDGCMDWANTPVRVIVAIPALLVGVFGFVAVAMALVVIVVAAVFAFTALILGAYALPFMALHWAVISRVVEGDTAAADLTAIIAIATPFAAAIIAWVVWAVRFYARRAREDAALA